MDVIGLRGWRAVSGSGSEAVTRQGEEFLLMPDGCQDGEVPRLAVWSVGGLLDVEEGEVLAFRACAWYPSEGVVDGLAVVP